MKELQYSHLPIHSFVKLADARPYDQLPISSDPSLLDAIEQANEEFEEDEAIRELAVKILAAFKTRNSVDALSQIASIRPFRGSSVKGHCDPDGVRSRIRIRDNTSGLCGPDPRSSSCRGPRIVSVEF